MNQFTSNVDVITGDDGATRLTSARNLLDPLIRILMRSGILKEDLDYHLIRASMVIIFLFFWVPEMVGVRSAGLDSVHQ